MKLDRVPSPLRPAEVDPPTYSLWWLPFIAGWLMAVVGFGSVAVFGFTSFRLLFGLTGAVLAAVSWPHRKLRASKSDERKSPCPTSYSRTRAGRFYRRE